MRVSPQITKHMRRPAEGRLRIHDPVLAEERAQECGKALRLGQMAEFAGETQPTPTKGPFQPCDEFAAEHAAEHLHWQEEAITRSNPVRAIRRQTSGRNRAMDMRMVQQVLPPRVQDAEEPDFRSEMFGVGSHFKERSRDGAEEQVVEEALVLKNERAQLAWQCKDDMEIRGCEEFPFTLFEPAVAGLRLALRAVAVTAGNGELSITCLMGSLF